MTRSIDQFAVAGVRAWIQIGYARIQIRMSLFTTFYFEFGYEYEHYRIRIQNGYFEFGFAFDYLVDLQHRVTMSINFICRWIIMLQVESKL
jgi:hypothetical protein